MLEKNNSEYHRMLRDLDEEKNIQWSEFYKFDQILKLDHWVVDKADKNEWRTTLEGRNGDLAKRDGCLLQQSENNPLKNDYCGLYMLRADNDNIGDDSGYCDYIGMSSAITPGPYQRGIYGRLADHVLKIQFLPPRVRIGKCFQKIMQGHSIEHYRSVFSKKEFSDYEELREFFKKDDKYQYSSTKKFKEFFEANKELLKTYKDVKEFLYEKVKIRFLNIPYDSDLHKTLMEKKISSKKNEAKLKDENTWSMALNSDEIKELKRIKNTRKIYDIIIKEAEDHAIKTYGKYYYDDEKRKPFLNYQKTKSGAKKEWMIRGFLEELKK